MGIVKSLVDKVAIAKAGNIIKKANQRLFELAKNFGTNNQRYQDEVNKIEKILCIDMKVVTRKSKGAQIDVYQIPNTKENKSKVAAPTEYIDENGKAVTASDILNGIPWVSDIRKKYAKKMKKESGKKKAPKKKEIDKFIRKYEGEYLPLLRDKMQEFYRWHSSNSLNARISGMSITQKIKFLKKLDPGKDFPEEVEDFESIRKILQSKGRPV